MFKKTLVCLDGSRLAEQILPYVTSSCLQTQGELILLQVVASDVTIPPLQSIHVPPFVRESEPDRPAPVSDLAGGSRTESSVSQQLEEISREQLDAEIYLDNIAKPLQGQGLKVRTLTLRGAPAEQILNYAVSSKISLIALTTHGRGGLKKGVLGSTAQDILRGWNLPVLLVRPTETGRERE